MPRFCCFFLYAKNTEILFIDVKFQDARSVSSYPYNRSQTLQYVKYTKLFNMAKGILQFRDKLGVLDKKVNTQQQQQVTKSNIKILARAGYQTRDL